MPSWLVSFPERLDQFLAADGRMLSRTKAQKAIEESRVKVNDLPETKVSRRLQEGDKVTLEGEEEPRMDDTIEPTDLLLTVLFEDDACMVLEKPAGIAVHPGAGMAPGEVTILHGVAHLFRERRLPFSPDAVLVHRLDKDTTGCLLVAKTAAAHQFLQKQFETRTVKKQYLALVAGIPEHPEAMIDAPIGRSTHDRTTMSVGGMSGREAQTTYKVLSSGKSCALLLCDLHTGRTHQVRVHLSSIGHPVLGDGTYTSQLSDRLTQEFDIRTLCLHAWKLTFTSPDGERERAVTAPLPPSLISVLERVGNSLP
ncbi:MAG: RluA family pseudouridine synthase [Candidatus Peribacteraceae bacterium]